MKTGKVIFLNMLIPLLGTAMSPTFGDLTLSFTNHTSTVSGGANEDQLVLQLDTQTLSASAPNAGDPTGVNAWLALDGSTTENDSFFLDAEVGFGFDANDPDYDTSEYLADPALNTYRFRFAQGTVFGFAPVGASAQFQTGEILHFTISGLEGGHRFVLTGYELRDNSSDRTDLFYGDGVTKVDTISPIMDVSGENIILGNGDQFGFGYTATAGARSNLLNLTFDIVAIPEPGSLPLVGVGLLACLILRRIISFEDRTQWIERDSTGMLSALRR
jgi:hypothetical protein